MIYHVGVKRDFTCRHFLVGDFGPESVPHEHRYTCEWNLFTSRLNAFGFAANIALMEESAKDVLDPMDHILLNDLPAFQGVQTSVENVAAWLEEQLFSQLAKKGENLGAVDRSIVRVYENQGAWAGVERSRRIES